MSRADARQATLLLGLVGVIATASSPTAHAPGASRSAQTPPPEFEIVSVRPRDDLARPGVVFSTGISELPSGRLLARAVTLLDLILHAYPQLRPFHVLDGPRWIRVDRFDVEALAEAGASAERRQTMVLRMLADRFRLQARFETRLVGVYALVVARTDGTLGPNLRLSSLDAPYSGAEPGLIEGRGIPLSLLVEMLTVRADRPVVDETRLSGLFDLELKWTPLPELQRSVVDPPEAGTTPAVPAEAVSLFVAVEEQLGLKLESKEAPFEMLVIQSAERPEPN